MGLPGNLRVLYFSTIEFLSASAGDREIVSFFTIEATVNVLIQ